MNRQQKQIYDFLAAKGDWMDAAEIAKIVFGEKWVDELSDIGHGLRMLEGLGRVEMRRVKVSGRPDKFEYRTIKGI